MSDARLREMVSRLVDMTPPSPPGLVDRQPAPRVRPWIGPAIGMAMVVVVAVPALLRAGDDTPIEPLSVPSTTIPCASSPCGTAPPNSLSQLEVVARLAPAAPGAIIGLPFFDGVERGLGFTLQRIDRENEVAVPLYWMISEPAGDSYDGPSLWGVWTGTMAEPSVLVSSVGVDFVLIPETAEPGEYLVCQARCFELRIVPAANAPRVIALLPPAAPGSLVDLPFDDGQSRGVGFKMALVDDPATPLWALTSDGHGGSPSWTPWWRGGFDLVLVSGGSDQVLIPDSATPDSYLICHAVGEPFCFWIQVTDDAPVTTLVSRDCQPLFQPLGLWVASCLIGFGSPVPVDLPIVVAGPSGVHVVRSDGAYGLVFDQPVSRGFIVGTILVTQGSSDSSSFLVPPDGPITVTDVSGTRTFSIGQRLVLFDAGVVNERPVMLVTVSTGSGPEDLEQRLLMVDLDTLDSVDLGVVGGWEWGAATAKLSPEVVVHAPVFGGSLTAVELDGTLKWERSFEWIGDEAGEVVVAGDSLLAVEPRFVGDEFAPFLDITELELATGIELGSVELALTLPEGVEIEGGFCQTAEYATGQLICSQTYGPPLVIDLETGDVLLLPVGSGAIPTPAR
jgi:hypothetical protein